MAKSKAWRKVEDSALMDWEKQKSKPIEGKLVSIVEAKSKKKGAKGEIQKYKIFRIETSSGLAACSGSQIAQKLAGVKIGQEVRIIYKGKAKTSSGFKVNTFDVFVR